MAPDLGTQAPAKPAQKTTSQVKTSAPVKQPTSAPCRSTASIGTYSVASFLQSSDDSESRDSRGQAITAVGWYLKEKETYRSHGAQDGTILTGGIKEFYGLDMGRT